MSVKEHTSNIIIQTLLFISGLFFFSNCSNNKENKIAESKKQVTFKSPITTLITNPVIINSDTRPAPEIIIIPKVASGTLDSIKLKSGTTQVKLFPPAITLLPVLKNENGEIIHPIPTVRRYLNGKIDFLPFVDNPFNSFILGEAGGFSQMQNYTTEQGLPLDAISCSIIDKVGNLWFGTDGGGVSRYDGKSFTNFTTAQGLANDVIFSIMEDKKGNLWFGTEGGGVSRYNGESFTNFTTKQGLANNTVFSIAEDKTGNIWFGTYGGGVSKYNPQSLHNAPSGRSEGALFTNFTTAQGLTHNVVRCITLDKTGNIWFGTSNGGVSCYNGNTFTNYTTAQGLARNVVRCMVEDKKGNLWFGTSGGGVSCFDGKSFITYTTAQGLVSNVVLSMAKDKRGNLWFGTDGQGISRFDGKSFTNYTTEQGLVNNKVWSITEDKTGNIWFGTDGGGVCRYDGKCFTNFSTKQGLQTNVVRSIAEDNRGNMWFGVNTGGVCSYDGKSFTNYSKTQGLLSYDVYSITEDKSGNLWFGSMNGGVFRFDGNRVEAIDAARQRGETMTLSMEKDLKKINGILVKSFTNFTTKQGLTNDRVFCIKEDKTGNIWFGTNGGGVSRYNGTSFTNYTTKQGLTGKKVWCVTEDKNGKLWFGTDGGGVSCYSYAAKVSEISSGQARTGSESFTNFTTLQGLANNVVYCITEDKTGNIWFGTPDGISRFDGKSFINYTTAHGLPDNTVTQVLISKEQNVVIGTNNGVAVLTGFSKASNSGKVGNTLFSIPAQNNMSNEELKNYTPVFEIYNSEMGYPVKDVNTGQNAMYQDSKGIIWIATGSDKTGLVRFDYNAVNRNPEPPAVVIQAIRINDENICWYDFQKGLSDVKIDSAVLAQQEVMTYGKILSDEVRDSLLKKFSGILFDSITKFYPLPLNLVLPYENNHVSFDYAAIEPSKPYLIMYQYFLEGYDKNWSPPTKKTNVSFGNINEGTYTFKLKAKSPFGVWSEPITYTFKVLPPLWRTWWMYTLYAILIVSCVLLLIRWNGRRLIEKAKELAREIKRATITIVEQKKIVEEKHKEITDSINYAERIQRSFLAAKELLDENLNDYFIFFQPKDVVSGDFYWASKLVNGNFALVTADSTGHGVPGAIMSILNISSLEKAVENGFSNPSEILGQTRKTIIERLKKDGSIEGGKDGMDASIICFDFANQKFTYSAANNPIWIIRAHPNPPEGRENQHTSQTEGIVESSSSPEFIPIKEGGRSGGAFLIELKPDKMPVGKHDKDQQPFTQNEFQLEKGDVIYTITDGFPDQFGGVKGKKFMSKQLHELILSVSHLPMPEQKQKLKTIFENWKGNFEQVDDVTIIGIRI